jgi:hypothetical protein
MIALLVDCKSVVDGIADAEDGSSNLFLLHLRLLLWYWPEGPPN